MRVDFSKLELKCQLDSGPTFWQEHVPGDCECVIMHLMGGGHITAGFSICQMLITWKGGEHLSTLHRRASFLQLACRSVSDALASGEYVLFPNRVFPDTLLASIDDLCLDESFL